MSVTPSPRIDPLEYVSTRRKLAINKKLAQNQLRVKLAVVELDTLPNAQALNSAPKMRPLEPKNPVFIMGELKPYDRTKFVVVSL